MCAVSSEQPEDSLKIDIYIYKFNSTVVSVVEYIGLEFFKPFSN